MNALVALWTLPIIGLFASFLGTSSAFCLPTLISNVRVPKHHHHIIRILLSTKPTTTMKNPFRRFGVSSSPTSLQHAPIEDEANSGKQSGQPSKEEEEDTILDAVIIGAGWAGLGAARYFLDKQQKQSFQFCVLEGHPDRIGGRSRTLAPISGEYPQSMVELGSQWIHGVHARNPVYQLAKQHDMILHYDRHEHAWGITGTSTIWYDKEEIIQESGQADTTSTGGTRSEPTRITERLEGDREEYLNKVLKKGFYQYMERYSRKQMRQKNKHKKNKKPLSANAPSALDKPRSVRDVLEEYSKLKQLTPQDSQCLYYMVDMGLTQDYAGSLEDIDAVWWDHDQEYGGGDCHFGFSNPELDDKSHKRDKKKTRGSVPGGYSELIQKFAEPLRIAEGKDANSRRSSSNNIIRCNCVVTSIDYTSDPVVIEYRHTNTTMTTPENESLETVAHRLLARKVLCTVPLGVLKAKSLQFTPPLPLPKCQAIERLGMGIYNKVVLVWKPEQRALLPWLLPLAEQQQQHHAPKSTPPEENGKATRRMWMERIRLPGEPQGPWTVCYNAHTHQQDASSPALLYFFLAGRLAQEVEQLSNEEMQQQAMAALRNWFENGSNGDTKIPEPEHTVLTRWHQDPLARGSYSYYQVGSSPVDRMELGRPLDDKVFFAGEAYHLQYYATVHGALVSGQSTAKTMWKQHAKQCRRQKSKNCLAI